MKNGCGRGEKKDRFGNTYFSMNDARAIREAQKKIVSDSIKYLSDGAHL